MKFLVAVFSVVSFVMFSVLLLVSMSMPLQAQQHQHQADNPVNIIDGSKTPDQIPDLVAYKMMFLSVSLTQDKLNDQQAIERRLAFVKQTGVLADEIPQVIKVLDDFRTQYELLVADWNKKATADQAKGVFDDPTEFANNINGLVLMTQLSLRATLSGESQLKFHSHVLGLKRHIKIS